MLAALGCLVVCGICDAFDGRIARTKKDRTEEEKNFGIQLDSLCDLVCFGVLPGLIGYKSGVPILIAGLYCLAAVIRLGYFNVLEWTRQQVEDGCRQSYRGLPVTSAAGLMPLIYLIGGLWPASMQSLYLSVAICVIGLLFVLDFKLKKPKLKEILLLSAAAGIVFGILVLVSMNRGGMIS